MTDRSEGALAAYREGIEFGRRIERGEATLEDLVASAQRAEAASNAAPDVVHRRCPHIESGSLDKHADFTFGTVAEGNTTSYAWHITAELCPFCSGLLYGNLSNILGPSK